MSQLVADDVFEYLKRECARLTNGYCSTLNCLKRGGYQGVPVNVENWKTPYEIATCEPYEAFQALKDQKDVDIDPSLS